MKPNSSMKILVIQQKMIGDVLISSLLCQHLKFLHPQSEIHYAIHSNTQGVVQLNPHIDRLIISTPDKNVQQWIALIRALRKTQYDLVVDAYGKVESLIMCRFSRAKAIYGHKKWFGPLIYTKTSVPSPKVYTQAGNAIEDRLRLIYPEEQIAENAMLYRPHIHMSQEETQWAKKLLKTKGLNTGETLIMVSVLGSAEDKSLPKSTMAEILSVLAQRPKTQLLLNYLPSQKTEVNRILSLVPAALMQKIHPEVYGKSLRQFLALLSQVNCLIGNEGGAVNMAKALNLPTFTLFSPWIHKAAWNSYDDGETHVGLHLKDFKPERFKDKTTLEIRQEFQAFYRDFKLDLFLNQMIAFCDRHQVKPQD